MQLIEGRAGGGYNDRRIFEGFEETKPRSGTAARRACRMMLSPVFNAPRFFEICGVINSPKAISEEVGSQRGVVSYHSIP